MDLLGRFSSEGGGLYVREYPSRISLITVDDERDSSGTAWRIPPEMAFLTADKYVVTVLGAMDSWVNDVSQRETLSMDALRSAVPEWESQNPMNLWTPCS